MSTEELQAKLARLKGTDVSSLNATPSTIVKPVEPIAVQEDDLLKQVCDQITLEKDMPDPDDEIAERLAKLKGVDVGHIKHPGQGLDQQASGAADPKVELDDSTLHDHSDYTLQEDDGSLLQEIAEVNKEVSHEALC